MTDTAELERERDYQRGQIDKLQAAADEALSRLDRAKAELGRISAQGRQQQFVPRAEYEAAVKAVTDAQRDHQRCLKSAGSAKRAMRLAVAELDRRPDSLEFGRKMVYAEHFVRLAKSLLPPETFAIIAESAQRAEEMQEDGKARELTGRVLPALGTSGGMRERAR